MWYKKREKGNLETKEMDFFITIIIVFATSMILFISAVFRKHLSQFTFPNLPPGNVGFPVIGETLSFVIAGRRGHPEKFISDRVSSFSSTVFKTHLFGAPMAVFCGASGNKFLFMNENKLVTSWWPESVNKIFPSSLQTSATEESKKLRKFLPQFLKPEALQGYASVMDEIAERHFDTDWMDKDKVLVYPLAQRYTLWLACRLFLGMEDPKEVKKFSESFNLLASGIISIPMDVPGTRFNRGVRAAKIVRKEIIKVIERRKMDLAAGKASPAQDILSHMVTHDETMKEEDVADKILGLLIGGHDTASAACTFVVKYLAELPHVYQAVYKEQMEIAKWKGEGERLRWEDIQKMRYSWNVACEVMRLSPPLHGAFREAIVDFCFDGFFIPKGWKLYWSATSTHRNPEYFPEPEKFEPRRFEGRGPAPYTYVPFGGGLRMCPGREYARLEILVFIHNLVKRFEWQKVLPHENVIVDPLPAPAKGLPVRLSRRT